MPDMYGIKQVVMGVTQSLLGCRWWFWTSFPKTAVWVGHKEVLQSATGRVEDIIIT